MIDDNNSRSTIRFILPFAVLLFLIPTILIKTCNENTDEKKYFDDLNLKLTGTIKYVDRPNASNGFGVIGVDIISCNKNHIDQRKKGNNYYCFINGNKAELYQIISNDILTIGDTIQVDTKMKSFQILKQGNIVNFSMHLYDNKSFFDFVQKNYQKF